MKSEDFLCNVFSPQNSFWYELHTGLFFFTQSVKNLAKKKEKTLLLLYYSCHTKWFYTSGSLSGKCICLFLACSSPLCAYPIKSASVNNSCSQSPTTNPMQPLSFSILFTPCVQISFLAFMDSLFPTESSSLGSFFSHHFVLRFFSSFCYDFLLVASCLSMHTVCIL